MKKALNIFFVSLGVIFLLIIIFLFTVSPINPLSFFINKDSGNATTTNSTEDKNPLLTPAQEKTVESFGINPASLPTTITPEMESCFVAKLGATRVQEIKNGSSPTASDYYKAKGCL